MARKPPFLFAAVAILYLVYEAWLLATNTEFPIAIRFIISLVLIFFLMCGSRVAGVLWLVCNLGAALVSLVATFRFAQNLPGTALWFAIASALLLANCGYLFFNSSVREFQKRRSNDA